MPTIVHLDIAADDVERARKFYEALFNWKMTQPPGMTDYYLIETEDLKGQPGVGGGLGKRGDPGQRITSYIGVDSVDDYCTRIGELGGTVIDGPRMMGNNPFCVIQDPAGAVLALIS